MKGYSKHKDIDFAPPFPKQDGIAGLQITSYAFKWINQGQKTCCFVLIPS